MTVPANIEVSAEFQDNRGFRSNATIHLFTPALDTGAGLFDVSVGSLWTFYMNGATSVLGALAAMSNAKVIRQSIAIHANYAQEPTSETGEYQLVQDKARLEFGDGLGGFASLSVPAPKDALFLTSSQDNLIVVNPASSLVTALQAAFTTSITQAAIGAVPGLLPSGTPRGGTWGAQFFGGQYQGHRSRRRRVLQGQ